MGTGTGRPQIQKRRNDMVKKRIAMIITAAAITALTATTVLAGNIGQNGGSMGGRQNGSQPPQMQQSPDDGQQPQMQQDKPDAAPPVPSGISGNDMPSQKDNFVPDSDDNGTKYPVSDNSIKKPLRPEGGEISGNEIPPKGMSDNMIPPEKVSGNMAPPENVSGNMVPPERPKNAVSSGSASSVSSSSVKPDSSVRSVSTISSGFRSILSNIKNFFAGMF